MTSNIIPSSFCMSLSANSWSERVARCTFDPHHVYLQHILNHALESDLQERERSSMVVSLVNRATKASPNMSNLKSVPIWAAARSKPPSASTKSKSCACDRVDGLQLFRDPWEKKRRIHTQIQQMHSTRYRIFTGETRRLTGLMLKSVIVHLPFCRMCLIIWTAHKHVLRQRTHQERFKYRKPHMHPETKPNESPA